MHGALKIGRRPRRLRRKNQSSLLPKIIVFLAAALLLRLFFSLLHNATDWFSSIGETAEGDGLIRTVLSAELGNSLGDTLRAFGKASLATGGSALLSDDSYPFQFAADDGFNGSFPAENDTAENTDASTIDTQAPKTSAVGNASQVIASGASVLTNPSPVPSSVSAMGSASDSAQPSAVDNDPNVRTVTILPSSGTGYDSADGVYIKNETSFDIDVGSYLKAKPDINLKAKGPLILIVHTHASEAYYPDGSDLYTPTDTERTNDKKYNVVRVGDEMAAAFKARGYETVHIRDIFDYPSYNGSYTRTLKAIEKALKEHPTIQMVIDVHRDAMVSANGSTYRTLADINGKKAAQVLLVVGTSEGGLKHPNWKKNLTLAVQLQKQLCTDSPQLARPINLRAERFNQHATNGSMLVEMGTSSNTLQEALYSAELFTDSLCTLLDSLRK